MKVMIVDDEPLEREVLTLMLKRENLEISRLYCADNGADAVDQMRQERMDVVLMDIEMPVMDGLMAAKLIKKDFPDCRIIFLTAHDEFDYAFQTIKLGVEDYLLKPAHPNDIRQALLKFIPEVHHPYPPSIDVSCDHVQTLIEHIENNLHLDLTLESLSDLVYLSDQYLSRLFKQEIGCTITQYITARRLDKAKECLRNQQDNIMEISEKCGFTDSNYFSRVFKKYEGITPTQYQQQSFVAKKKRMNSFNNFVM
ncbi:response regulator [Halobacillus sp. Marseille-Q1614]|uniref:response regulator transcription factor n=1 Tax=Halobacillus sp. Marseille-Q1614 TaxID=2709134 RepID=UPI00157072B0|nr:response regulator [Halobacillus sp. Marseille-Q1614]